VIILTGHASGPLPTLLPLPVTSTLLLGSLELDIFNGPRTQVYCYFTTWNDLKNNTDKNNNNNKYNNNIKINNDNENNNNDDNNDKKDNSDNNEDEINNKYYYTCR
jgi:hypothetical protein